MKVKYKINFLVKWFFHYFCIYLYNFIFLLENNYLIINIAKTPIKLLFAIKIAMKIQMIGKMASRAKTTNNKEKLRIGEIEDLNLSN